MPWTLIRKTVITTCGKP